MRSLSKIIELKVNELGGNKSELARKLKWGDKGTNPSSAISQYIKGINIPSIDFAIRWKEVFNENLIDMMLGTDLPIVEEPKLPYEQVKDKLITAYEQLAECRVEKENIKKELDEIKKILPDTKLRELKPQNK